MSLRTAARQLRAVPRVAVASPSRLISTGPVATLPRTLSSSSLSRHSLPLTVAARSSLSFSRRYSSTPHGDPGVDPSIAVRDLTEQEYHDLADRAMDTLHENLEIFVEDFGAANWEVEYSSGVMTLSLPPHGTYVINKQPPNHQIWVSSPFSGPSRFSFGGNGDGEVAGEGEGTWVHHRKAGVSLGRLLDSELKSVLKELREDGWDGVGLK